LKKKKEVQLETKDIKYALKNYYRIKEYIRIDLLELEAIQCQMEGQGGGSIIPFDQRGKEIAEDRTSMIIDLIDKKDAIKSKISENTYYLQIAKDFIMWLEGDTRKMVIDKYIKRMSNIELEGKYFYNPKYIYEIIDKKIEQFIDEM